MIKHRAEMSCTTREALRGGRGVLNFTHIF